MTQDVETARINLAWLVRFRSLEILLHATAIAVAVLGLDVDLPLRPLAVILAIEVATNVGAWIRLRRTTAIPRGALGALLSLDVLLFSGILSVAGGPYNPFSFLYVIQVALGAFVLSEAGSIALACLCVAAFFSLFAWHVWLPMQGNELGPHELHHLRSHVQGMAIALVVASGFIAYFVQRVRRALVARESELAGARDLAQRHERLAALATLSAGAAHELSTPLSTIAVAAVELERQLVSVPEAAALQSDVRLIREQVDRCRRVLVQLAAKAGENAGEAAEAVAVERVIREALRDLPAQPPIAVELNGLGEAPLRVPPTVLAQALSGIVRNAQQASPLGASPRLCVETRDGLLAFAVVDAGPGMGPDVLARAGEPFFTTKAPGDGMGLGLFLARTTAEQLGGALQIESRPGATRVVLLVPRPT